MGVPDRSGIGGGGFRVVIPRALIWPDVKGKKDVLHINRPL